MNLHTILAAVIGNWPLYWRHVAFATRLSDIYTRLHHVNSQKRMDLYMSTAQKALLTIFIVPILVVLSISIAWDANWFKSDVETQLTDLENHSVNFDRFEHSLLSPGLLSIHDINIQGGIVTGQIGSVTLDVEVLPALSKRILVKQITINNAIFNVDAQALQHYSEAKRHEPQKETTNEIDKLPIEVLNIESILLRNVSFKDVSSQQLFAVNNANVEVSNVTAVDDFELVLMKTEPPIRASLFIEKAIVKQALFGKISGEALLNENRIDMKSLSLASTNSNLFLTGVVKNPKRAAEIQLTVQDSSLDVADFAPLLGKLPVIPSGKFHVEGRLDTQGNFDDPKALLKHLSGDLALGLDNGALQGIDINKIVTAIKDSKKTSFRDVGSFLITGPIGLIASNMFDLSGAASAFDGTTEIPQLKLNSRFDKGKVELSDTAVSTDKNRLAFSGVIDLNERKFNDFTFALLDSKGCADVKQTLNGDFNQPTSAVSKSLLDSALSPIKDILGSVTKTLGKDKECQPFYQGEVTHPVSN